MLVPPPTPCLAKNVENVIISKHAPGASMVFLSEDINPDSPFAAVLILSKDFLLAVRGDFHLEEVVALLCVKLKPERRDHAAFDDRTVGIDLLPVEERLTAGSPCGRTFHIS